MNLVTGAGIPPILELLRVSDRRHQVALTYQQWPVLRGRLGGRCLCLFGRRLDSHGLVHHRIAQSITVVHGLTLHPSDGLVVRMKGQIEQLHYDRFGNVVWGARGGRRLATTLHRGKEHLFTSPSKPKNSIQRQLPSLVRRRKSFVSAECHIG